MLRWRRPKGRQEARHLTFPANVDFGAQQCYAMIPVNDWPRLPSGWEETICQSQSFFHKYLDLPKGLIVVDLCVYALGATNDNLSRPESIGEHIVLKWLQTYKGPFYSIQGRWGGRDGFMLTFHNHQTLTVIVHARLIKYDKKTI